MADDMTADAAIRMTQHARGELAVQDARLAVPVPPARVARPAAELAP